MSGRGNGEPGDPRMATLYLIRHGEPELRGVFLGPDGFLASAAGHIQVHAALTGLDVAVTYTSPLSRARQTATYIRSVSLSKWKNYVKSTMARGPERHGQRLKRLGRFVTSQIGKLAWNPGSGRRGWQNVMHRARWPEAGYAAARAFCRSGPSGHQRRARQPYRPTDPLQFQQQYGEVIRFDYD